MPPKRSQNRSKSRNKAPQNTKESTPNPMADCVFPQDILIGILTRLPVKSLLRFKSVCKPWRKLIATPKFVKLHYDQFSSDPQNQAFIIYSLSQHYYVHTMSLFKIESDEKKPTDLDHPYPEIFFRMNFVGCCNGLLCMGCPPLGQAIVLWNPAMKLFKFVRLSKAELGNPEFVSLGFGYDDEGDDFKVVRVVCLEGAKIRVGIEVYSAKSETWKTIKPSFQFNVFRTKNDAIVNGNPYWLAKIRSGGNSELGLIWFDVKKMVWEKVPLANLSMAEGTQIPLVEWKGSIAALMSGENKDRKGYYDVCVFVFDGAEKIWKLENTFGPIGVKVGTCVQCSKNGKIIGLCLDGTLFVFDPEKGWVKVIAVDEAQPISYEVYGYSESLACLKGMEPLVVKKEEEEKDEDDDDDDGSKDHPAVDIAGFLTSYLQIHGGEAIGNYPLAF